MTWIGIVAGLVIVAAGLAGADCAAAFAARRARRAAEKITRQAAP